MEGKTIKEYTLHDRYMLINFTDGSRMVFAAVNNGWDSVDLAIELEDETAIGDYDQRELGLISNDEYQARQSHKLQESRRLSELQEKEQFERLKKKFS